MAALQGAALVLAAVAATVVVLAGDPKRQIVLYTIYGLTMTIALALLHAPDVALSELAVGSVAIPFAVLATLVRMEHGEPK